MPDTPMYEMLFVEDNAYDRELAMRALEKANLVSRTYVAQDGAEALDFVFGTGAFADRNMLARLKVIVLDMKLPKVDGLEILRRLRGHALTRLLPVVFLTGSKEPREVFRAYHLGASSYIAKPMIFEYYVDVVRDIGLYWLRHNLPPRDEK